MGKDLIYFQLAKFQKKKRKEPKKGNVLHHPGKQVPEVPGRNAGQLAVPSAGASQVLFDVRYGRTNHSYG